MSSHVWCLIIRDIELDITDWLAGWLADWLAGWLAGWLDGWLAGWLTGWMADWLTDWVHVWIYLPCMHGYFFRCTDISPMAFWDPKWDAKWGAWIPAWILSEFRMKKKPVKNHYKSNGFSLEKYPRCPEEKYSRRCFGTPNRCLKAHRKNIHAGVQNVNSYPGGNIHAI